MDKNRRLKQFKGKSEWEKEADETREKELEIRKTIHKLTPVNVFATKWVEVDMEELVGQTIQKVTDYMGRLELTTNNGKYYLTNKNGYIISDQCRVYKILKEDTSSDG